MDVAKTLSISRARFRFLRLQRSHGFRLFFAAAAAVAKNNSLPNSLHHKCFFVLPSTLRNQFVNWAARRNAGLRGEMLCSTS